MCASALLGKMKTSDMCIEMNKKKFNKFYIYWPVSPNSQLITRFDCLLAAPDDVQECWWIQKVTGEIWIGLEQNIIDTAVNKSRNHLCACGPDTLKIFYCRQLKKRTIRWTVSSSDKNVENVFYVLFWLSNNAPLDKNTIFCWFCFPQVVQKPTLDAVGN